MRLFFLNLFILFSALNLSATDKTFDNTVTAVKKTETGYKILFTIPDEIRATFDDGQKTRWIFVKQDEDVGETARKLDLMLRVGKGAYKTAIILIDGNQLDGLSWKSIITITESLFNERKNDYTPYVPTFEVKVHQFYDTTFELPGRRG